MGGVWTSLVQFPLLGMIDRTNGFFALFFDCAVSTTIGVAESFEFELKWCRNFARNDDISFL